MWGVVLQGHSMEGLYWLANICEMLCYNGQFKDYNGLYAIATDLIFKKKEISSENSVNGKSSRSAEMGPKCE